MTTTSVSAYKATRPRLGSKGHAVAALERALGMRSVDTVFGYGTVGYVKAFQKAKGLPVTGAVDRATWDALELTAHPLLPYRGTVVREGSRGPAVKALQRALHLKADGVFGPQTKAAVKSAQKRGHIASTGAVGVLGWVTIEKLAYPVGRRNW